jgi:hypothetical protein
VHIGEVVLLSLVTIAAAWSGYAAAKWITESRIEIAEAATRPATTRRSWGTTTSGSRCSWPRCCSWSVLGSIFKLYTVRYSLIGVGSLLLILAIVLILQQPGLRADRHLGRRLVGPTWLLLCGAGRLTSGWSPVGEACRWWIPPPGSLTRFLPLG